jgi:hypothetical protein
MARGLKMTLVKMADGSEYKVNTLLGKGDSNTKLSKSDKSGKGYLTVGLSLAPAKESGYEVCSNRSLGCTQACIFTSGHGVYAPVRLARIAKTRLWFQDRDTFKSMLVKELQKHVKRATKQGKRLACRLNVFSDIAWEKVWPELFVMFPQVQFYDYTKNVNRAAMFSLGELPKNYHLTFSRSETNSEQVKVLLELGCKTNIAVVFDSKDLPSQWQGRSVVNGDETDLRFLDKPYSIVGLYAKGKGKKDESGFVVQLGLIKR